MKYVIDIPDDIYHVVLMNGVGQTCSFHKKSDLMPYTELNRKAIEDEVWEFAATCTKMSGADSVDAFGDYSIGSFTKYSYQEAKSKYKEWKRRKDEIYVGDEVEFYNGEKLLVTNTDLSDDYVQGISKEGECYEIIEKADIRKTGRSFPEVIELLEKMKEE